MVTTSRAFSSSIGGETAFRNRPSRVRTCWWRRQPECTAIEVGHTVTAVTPPAPRRRAATSLRLVLAPMRPLSTSSRDWEQREIIERHETLRNQIATLTDLVLALRTEQAECTRTTTHVHESAAREVRARGLGRDTKQAPETNISAPQRPHNIQRDSPSRQAAGSGTRNAPRLDEPVSQRVAGEDLCQGLEEAVHRLKSESEEDSGRRDNLTDDAGRQHRNERRQNINPSGAST